MFSSARVFVLLSFCFRGLLFVTLVLPALTAQAQKPLLYLTVSNPTRPLLNSPLPDIEPITAIFEERLQANGYRVVTQPDTLRRLLAQPEALGFLYADVLCYHQAGGFPTVVFAVRDTLNAPWFIIRESTKLFLAQSKGFSSAAQYVADKLPAIFTSRFAETPDLPDRVPQFMAYDNFQFTTYLDGVLYTKSLRQQLKQGAALELDIQVDELGVATLQKIGSQLILDAPTRQLLEAAIRNTPPWAPALRNGRRTATVIHLKKTPRTR
ncbi:hypothetical protein D0N36_19750 [Hymenobacter lapidiphilus]|uniref:hypothetical protein n=1 Tax=Hymenobacter sp. CCM 8763 TaxID=2303334 RepID=UPI000E3493C9|nr:hypothetical protein [Hymenobacter sp. CCM 8763]RFP63369.1 hypothetical protein D0N36_19750 [Hymenobacter sp. CCM 8763]